LLYLLALLRKQRKYPLQRVRPAQEGILHRAAHASRTMT
jgi:hypothetical protein